MNKHTPRSTDRAVRVTATDDDEWDDNPQIQATDMRDEARAALAADPATEIYVMYFSLENDGSDRSGHFGDAYMEAEGVEAVLFADAGRVGICWGADAEWFDAPVLEHAELSDALGDTATAELEAAVVAWCRLDGDERDRAYRAEAEREQHEAAYWEARVAPEPPMPPEADQLQM